MGGRGGGGERERESSVQLSSESLPWQSASAIRNPQPSPLVLPCFLSTFYSTLRSLFHFYFSPLEPLYTAKSQKKKKEERREIKPEPPAGNHGFCVCPIDGSLPSLFPNVLEIRKMGNLGDLSPQSSVAVS